MRENKAEITKHLLPLLQMTRGGSDIADLTYEKVCEGYERVTILFDNGTEREVSVTYDSGTALIKDVIRGIE